MPNIDFSEKSLRSRLLNRTRIASGIVALLVIAIALCGLCTIRSSRFSELRPGMTCLEAGQILDVRLVSHDARSETWYVDYSESPLLPDFTVKLDLVDGRIGSKELQRPRLSKILDYWVHKTRHR
jgi:hypothetical protein